MSSILSISKAFSNCLVWHNRLRVTECWKYIKKIWIFQSKTFPNTELVTANMTHRGSSMICVSVRPYMIITNEKFQHTWKDTAKMFNGFISCFMHGIKSLSYVFTLYFTHSQSTITITWHTDNDIHVMIYINIYIHIYIYIYIYIVQNLKENIWKLKTQFAGRNVSLCLFCSLCNVTKYIIIY